MTKDNRNSLLIGTIGTIALGSYLTYKNKVKKSRKESLRGKVVIITGASEGIGKAYAEEFAKLGCKLVLAARSTEKIDNLAKEISVLCHVDVIAVTTDVSKENDSIMLIEKALDHFGHIDILINNAGVASYGYFKDSNLDDMKKMMDINYWGTVYCTYAVLPSMIKRGKGHIINVSSVVGKRAMPVMSGYSASKFAMQGLSESLRVELKKYGIGLTVICPTTTKTELVNNALQNDRVKFGTSMGMSSERVAKETIEALTGNKREHILGLFENVGLTIDSSFPSLGDNLLNFAQKFMIKE